MDFRERKRNRLQNYDYSQNGLYFVTICTKNKEELFGNVKNEKMILNEYGRIAKKCWREIPRHFPAVELDEFVVMPNHVHGIIEIVSNNTETAGNKNLCSTLRNNARKTVVVNNNNNALENNANIGNKNFCSPLRTEIVNDFIFYDNVNPAQIPWQTKLSRSLPAIIRGFKIGVTKYFRDNNRCFQWQKSFYDCIIWDEQCLNNIRKYIRNNPANWRRDLNNK
ncbi:hypothetical protein KKC32_03470 [Patescibacteria group bacterium]|nr:hypothetical protein [Patescibacteria group bacterium]